MTTPESNMVPSPMMPPMRRDSTLAIVSLVSGIVAWILIPFFGAIAAIICGHLAKKEIRESNGTLSGDGMALAGLILGYVQIGVIVLGGLCLLAFGAALFPAISSQIGYY